MWTGRMEYIAWTGMWTGRMEYIAWTRMWTGRMEYNDKILGYKSSKLAAILVVVNLGLTFSCSVESRTIDKLYTWEEGSCLTWYQARLKFHTELERIYN